MSTTPIDYTALAKQAGAIDSQPAPSASASRAPTAGIDYTALAKQAGAVDSQHAPQTSAAPDSAVPQQPRQGFLTGLISNAKDAWTKAQAIRDAEARVATTTIDALKKGDYGTAAETLLDHLAHRAIQAGQGIADVAVSSVEQAYRNAKATLTQRDPLNQNVPFDPQHPERTEVYGQPVLPMGGPLRLSAAGEDAFAVARPPNPFRSPGFLKKVVQGAKAAQPEAISALQKGVQASAEDAGVAEQVTPAVPAQGVRTFLDKPIAATAKIERATYDAYNRAAETDMKALYDHQSDVQDALDDPTNIANRTALEADLKNTQASIQKGETLAQSKDPNLTPDTISKAKAMTQQRYAMQSAKQKIFNNESVVKGNVLHGSDETIQVDSAIRNAENLNKPSKYAPEGSPTRLQQAFGKQGADNLLKGLYQSQRTGQSAVTLHTIAKWVGATLGGATILKGVEVLGAPSAP